MLLNDFMNDNFPNLQLSPPLFYNWEIGIRFELGLEWNTIQKDCDRRTHPKYN